MIAVSPTDLNWFTQLRDDPAYAEVNFWTPTPWNVKTLQKDDKFYFLLKAPIRKIAGYGEFAYYETMSASQAWQRYGPGNGVRSLDELVTRITGYANRRSDTFAPTDDPEIGCIILHDAVFLDEASFFAPEDVQLDFARQIVKFKTFPERTTLDIPAVRTTTREPSSIETPFQLVDPVGKQYREVRVGDRPGQSTFRGAVLQAYEYRCAVSGETCREVLEAAHIQPYVNADSDDVRNGLPLRTDIHRLFDAGLITVSQEYRIQVSTRLRSSLYRALEGTTLRLPADPEKCPAPTALEFHRRFVYRG